MPNDKSSSLEQFISADKEIDVQEIMSAIQKRIQDKKNSGGPDQSEIDEIEEMELLPIPDFLDIPNVYASHLYPGPGSPQDEFHPLEFTIEKEEGPGIRGMIKKILSKMRKILFPLVRFMTRPVFNELKQFAVDRYNTNAEKLFKIEWMSRQSKDYIKLLHNAMNNLIAETTRLKIDQELLKTRLNVLEDKIEFLENRERAIEKKIFPTNRTGA